MRNLKLILATAALAVLTTACSVDGNITDMTVRKVTAMNSQMTGIVPGANDPNVLTGGGYLVQSSVGDTYGSIRSVSAGSYEVYSNVQGNTITDSATVVTIE